MGLSKAYSCTKIFFGELLFRLVGKFDLSVISSIVIFTLTQWQVKTLASSYDH